MQSNNSLSSSISPSFTSNSSTNNNLSDIAARVVEEFRHENNHNDYYDDNDIFNFHNSDYNNNNKNDNNNEEEFEFSSSISAHQKYPLFDTSLLSDIIDPNSIKIVNDNDNDNDNPKLRLPLFKLLSLERDFKSEVDDLAGVAPGTYCVWNPKSKSPEKCNSSRRWKFRNIFNRSNSFGKVAAAENKDHRRRSYLPSGEDLVTAIVRGGAGDSHDGASGGGGGG